MDIWDETKEAFQSVPLPSVSSSNASDSALPPLHEAQTVTFHVFLDLENPLSMPRWVKTGDVDDWLQIMFGAMMRPNVKGGGQPQGWEGKITVVDPDPVSVYYHQYFRPRLNHRSTGANHSEYLGNLGD